MSKYKKNVNDKWEACYCILDISIFWFEVRIEAGTLDLNDLRYTLNALTTVLCIKLFILKKKAQFC